MDIIRQSAISALVIIGLIGTANCNPAKKAPTTPVVAPVSARVTLKVGNVTLERAGATRKLNVNELIVAGDTVRTNAKASAELFIQDQGIVRLAENSQLNLADLNHVKTEVSVVKGSGGFFLKKQGRKGNFIVRTPTAIASVRGTTFLVDVHSEKETRVALFTGSVEVSGKSKEKSVVLSKKSEIIVRKEADISRKSIRPLSDRSLKAIKRLAVFHKSNVLEYNQFIEELNKSQKIDEKIIDETVSKRYTKLEKVNRDQESVRKATLSDEKLIKKDTSDDPLKLDSKKKFK